MNEEEKKENTGEVKEYNELTREEKKDLWEKINDWFSLPDEEKNPKKQVKLYTSLKIPERTFYNHTADERFISKWTHKSLNKAKNRLPDIAKKVAEKAEAGDNVSIAQFFEFILQIKKGLDITSGGEKLNFDIGLKKEIEEKLKNVINED